MEIKIAIQDNPKKKQEKIFRNKQGSAIVFLVFRH